MIMDNMWTNIAGKFIFKRSLAFHRRVIHDRIMAGDPVGYIFRRRIYLINS
jgi:hypothetical protein